MPGCSDLGGCANSVDNGGQGCRLRDWAAKLPQPKFRMPAADGGTVTRKPPSKAMTCVFVEVDGKVGFRDLPADYADMPVFRVPRRVPVKVTLDWSQGDTVECTYDEYLRDGVNFDRNPIFCAKGWRVEQAYINAYASDRDAADVDEHLRRSVRKFVKDKFGEFVELGEKYGPLAFGIHEDAKGYRAQGIGKRHVRLLVAVCTAKPFALAQTFVHTERVTHE